MAGKLILLPFRVWLRSARLLTRAAGGAAERAFTLAGHAIPGMSPARNGNGAQPDSQRAVAEPPWSEEFLGEPVSPVDVEHPHETVEVERPRDHDEPRAARPQPDATPAPSVSAETPPVAEPEAPAVREPVHVSEEPELVREAAEPGAEEGAGAGVTVLEPWNGYDHMNAREIIARAKQADQAVLAAVRLYESRRRSRQTVLAAVDRQLKLTGGGSPA